MKYTYSSSDLNKAQPSGGNATQGKTGAPAVTRGHGAGFLILMGVGCVAAVGIALVLLWQLVRYEKRSAHAADNAVRETKELNTKPAVAAVSSAVAEVQAPHRLALSVGLDIVSAEAYGGHPPAKLEGCVIDALRFTDLLKDAGFETVVLENSKATIENVRKQMLAAADVLKPNDFFVMLVSGHGGEHDIRGKKHSSWCLYDGILMDTEIVQLFSKFRRDVRVLIVNDQCFAGGVFMEKALPSDEMVKEMNRLLLDPAYPMIIQFAGCRAEQTSRATIEGSTWTLALVRGLDAFPNRDCTLRQWFDKAFTDARILRGRQDPQWIEKGRVSDSFRNGVFFNIKPRASGSPSAVAP